MKKQFNATSTSFKRVRKRVEICRAHSCDLIDSAKILLESKKANIAYHLAALALEEIGKSIMMLIGISMSVTETERIVSDKRSDDHIRKLFWALWMPSLIDTRTTVEHIHKCQNLANEIHDKRLAGLYVDPTTDVRPRSRIRKRETKRLIALAEARIRIEESSKLQNLSKVEKDDLNWFIFAKDDDYKRKLIFGQKSLNKLKELNQNYKKWMRWLREQFEEAERENIALLNKELARSSQFDTPASKPKWKYHIRLTTPSHSIHRDVVAWWNMTFNRIRFQHVRNNEITVEFVLPQKVLLFDFLDIGLSQANQFILSLNIATAGFFYYKLSGIRFRFYEKLTDLENNSEVCIQKTHKTLDWGNNLLTRKDLTRTAIVFGSIRILFKENKGYVHALSHYLNGLMYMSKNDALSDFEPYIFMSFLEAFKSFMRASGDWDGKEEFIDVLRRLLIDLHLNIPDFVEIGRIMARIGKKKFATVNLERAAKLKVMCDLYFFKRFKLTYDQFNEQRMLLFATLSNILSKRSNV